jgi:hypothetical protein
MLNLATTVACCAVRQTTMASPQAALLQAVVEVCGKTLNVTIRGYADTALVIVGGGASHGTIVSAQCDLSRLAPAATEADACAAVDSETLIGKRNDDLIGVISRRLAAQWAAAGDARPLTLCIDVDAPEPAQRREFVTGVVSAVLCVAGLVDEPSAE